MSTMTSPARARTATMVVVGPTDRLTDAADTLKPVDESGGVRSVLISLASASSPPVEMRQDVISIDGLRPEYLNNAIAALRLSSLPTVVWWRGGPPERLDGAAALADRVVLDAEDPAPIWIRATQLFEASAFTDVRWARLTRWRALMAHFFDLPQIRDAERTFTRLSLSGTDRFQCSLFAAWLDASLGWRGRIVPEISQSERTEPMSAIELTGDVVSLTLSLLPGGGCVSTEARMKDHVLASRVAPLGDQSLPALLIQELRIRSRDLAFEQALTTVVRTT